jgi:RimJ/RimL family protein N-acetyltransferase
MTFPAVEPVESPRLVLRPVAVADLPDLLEINGDAEVTRFLPYATWQSLQDGEAWLARMLALGESGKGQQLVVVRRADAKVIGTLLLFNFVEASGRLELGYVLGRAHWGQGYMREAIGVACTQAFGALGVRRIEAEVNPENRSSCAVLQRAGFTQEGTLRQRWVGKTGAYDTCIYGLLIDDHPTP